MPGTCTRRMVPDVNLDPALGSKPNKTRPCVVIQNNIGNRYSPVSIIAIIAGAENVPRRYPVYVFVQKGVDHGQSRPGAPHQSGGLRNGD